MVTFLLLSGCLAARLSQGSVLAFDDDEPAHPEAHTDLDVGATMGVVEVTLGGQLRASAKGAELNLVPMGCLHLPILDAPFGAGGCAGVTLLGLGRREGSGTFLAGGPQVQAFVLWAPAFRSFEELLDEVQDGEPQLLLRAGFLGGLDVRTGGRGYTPYTGVTLGLEVWWWPFAFL